MYRANPNRLCYNLYICNTFTPQIKGKSQCINLILHWLWNFNEIYAHLSVQYHDIAQPAKIKLINGILIWLKCITSPNFISPMSFNLAIRQTFPLYGIQFGRCSGVARVLQLAGHKIRVLDCFNRVFECSIRVDYFDFFKFSLAGHNQHFGWAWALPGPPLWR